MRHLETEKEDFDSRVGKKVLIVDDDPRICWPLELFLASWGYEVTVARDGVQAWRVLQQEDAPRLAILDWTMPGLDGVQICHKVRQLPNRPHTYITLLCTRAEKEHAIGARRPRQTIT